jgi:hypothetical protein
MALSDQETQALLTTLKNRFENHMQRHPAVAWAEVQARLEAHPGKLAALAEMERTGGEPDVVAVDPQSGEVTFFDCATESPKERRSLCYDDEALAARKANKPAGSAMGVAAAMGVALLDEAQYHHLQQLGEFDLKTSSWLKSPDDVRERGGAIFGDRRYGRVFIYHNGADSYYGARGFRGALIV